MQKSVRAAGARLGNDDVFGRQRIVNDISSRIRGSPDEMVLLARGLVARTLPASFVQTRCKLESACGQHFALLTETVSMSSGSVLTSCSMCWERPGEVGTIMLACALRALQVVFRRNISCGYQQHQEQVIKLVVCRSVGSRIGSQLCKSG